MATRRFRVASNCRTQSPLENGKKCDNEKALYNEEETPKWHREPFIQSGYRKVNSTFGQCIQSMFYLNNESFNIWSHVLSALYFMARFAFLAWPLMDGSSVIKALPLISAAMGTTIVYSTSAIAHIFSSMSEKAHKTCFFFDYAGISVYTFTSSQVMFFYTRPVNSNWMIFESPYVYLSIAAFLSCFSTYACCKTNTTCKPNKFNTVFRTASVFFAWLIIELPFSASVTLCSCHATTSCFASSACNSLSVHYYASHVFSMALAALHYSSRLPERLFPGKFDFFGNSHHFLHVYSAMGTEFALKAIDLEINDRNTAGMLEETTAFVSLGNTIGAAILVMLVNAGIAIWFARSIKVKERVHEK